MASSPEINRWNDQWRSSPLYRQIAAQLGIDLTRPIRLTDQQRKEAQRLIEQATGKQFPKGTEIDPSLNWNEDEGFGKQLRRWGPVVAGAGIGLFGIPGLFPGLLNRGGDGPPELGNLNDTVDRLARGTPSFLDRLTPDSWRDVARFAPLAAPFIPGGGGNSNPFSSDAEQGLFDEMRQGLQIQRQRVEQTQPVFDDLVRRTTNAAPNASYGGSAYQYQGPRFGG